MHPEPLIECHNVSQTHGNWDAKTLCLFLRQINVVVLSDLIVSFPLLALRFRTISIIVLPFKKSYLSVCIQLVITNTRGYALENKCKGFSA